MQIPLRCRIFVSAAVPFKAQSGPFPKSGLPVSQRWSNRCGQSMCGLNPHLDGSRRVDHRGSPPGRPPEGGAAADEALHRGEPTHKSRGRPPASPPARAGTPCRRKARRGELYPGQLSAKAKCACGMGFAAFPCGLWRPRAPKSLRQESFSRTQQCGLNTGPTPRTS